MNIHEEPSISTAIELLVPGIVGRTTCHSKTEILEQDEFAAALHEHRFLNTTYREYCIIWSLLICE